MRHRIKNKVQSLAQTLFDKHYSICYTYDMKKQQQRKAIFVPLEVWQKLKKMADKNNRSLVGQLKEFVKSNVQ